MAGNSRDPKSGLSRRSVLKGVGVAAVAGETLLSRMAKAADAIPGPDGTSLDQPMSGPVKITLNINGKDQQVTVEPRTTLLSALRDRLEPALTGPKLVCNAGTCGACTMILNGKNVYGCSVLAIDAVGKKITTVEGLGTPDHMSPVQAAFMEKDGMMCGMCTSGFVTSVSAFLKTNPNPTLDELKQGLKGNFCRCGTYPRIFEAALSAAKAQSNVT
ncbi:MAG TPA: (2Fe-2S)-binding protein [Tepidisphaeraceae bacterium]|nr:(2Fe-2S)-binding protein [Tepidisphaeraceae bacterium]